MARGHRRVLEVARDPSSDPSSYAGRHLWRGENEQDITAAAGAAPTPIPNLEREVAKVANRALRVEFGGRLYNSEAGKVARLELLENGVPIRELAHTSGSALAYTTTSVSVTRADLPTGPVIYAVQLVAAGAGTTHVAHAWGAARNATYLEITEG